VNSCLGARLRGHDDGGDARVGIYDCRYHRSKCLKFICHVLAAALAIALACGTALACRSLGESSTLMRALPDEVRSEPVIAKVEVIELLADNWDPSGKGPASRRVRVKVIEAINGVRVGETFIVNTGNSSCSQRIDRAAWKAASAANRRYYIAGNKLFYNGDTVFVGGWSIDWDLTSTTRQFKRRKNSGDLRRPLIMFRAHDSLVP
jgi:hypothetical protein